MNASNSFALKGNLKSLVATGGVLAGAGKARQAALVPATKARSHFARYSATVLVLGGGAAGSHGAIVYSNPADVTLIEGQETRVDFLTGTFGGPSGLLFRYSSSEYVELHPSSSAVSGVASDGGGNGRITRFVFGNSIGAAGGTAGWDSGWSYVDYENEAGYPWNTDADGTTGYLGIRLNNNGTEAGTYYGWLGITYDDASDSVTLHDFAYETTAGLAIGAGISVVPEPAYTGLLAAMGAAGLAAWRHLKKGRPA